MNKNSTQSYFDKECNDFNASYTDATKLKDFIRRLSFRYNEKSIVGRMTSLLSLVGNPAQKKILEVGTGPGFYAIEIAKNGGEVTGLDFSSGMLENARDNAQKESVNIDFIEGDILTTSIDKKFDTTFATGVIEYIPKENQLDFVKKLTDLSTDTIIISFPKKFVLHALIRTIWLTFFKKIKVNYFTNSDIARLAEAASIVEVERENIKILWVIKFKKSS